MERRPVVVILSAFGGLRQSKRVIGRDYAEFSAWASGENLWISRRQSPEYSCRKPVFLGDRHCFSEKMIWPAN